MEVVGAITKVADNKASEQIVEQLIPTLWPRLQESLERISDTEPSGKRTISQTATTMSHLLTES